MNWNFHVLRGLARLTFAQQLILLALVPATAATLAAIAVLTRQHLDNLTELMLSLIHISEPTRPY